MMSPDPNPFWQINIGNLITLVSLFLALAGFHQSNKKRIQQDTQSLEQMKMKLDLLYNWFVNNVIGGGEPPHYRSGRGDD